MINKKKIGASINLKLLKELDEYCDKNGIIRSRYIEKAIKLLLDKDKKNEE
jgi:metal-responsive CopG/Arc/MetJ family transcriptional regulator